MPGPIAAPAPAPTAPAAPAASPPAQAGASPPAAPAAAAKAGPLSPAQKRTAAHAKLQAQPVATPAAPAGSPPAAPAPSAEPAATEPPKGPSVAQLATQNRQLARQLAEMRAQLDGGKGDVELITALRSADPAKRFDALSKLGVKYDEWTQHQLQAAGVATEAPPDETPRERELRERLAALEGKHTEAEQAVQRANAEREQARRIEYARSIITEGGEKYALTAALGRHGDLLHEHERMVREEALDKPDPHVVAANVEKLHEQALRKQIGALIATAKGKAMIAELLGVSAAPASEGDPKPPAPTNALSAERGASSGVHPDFHKWTPAQKREWASKRARASA